MKKAIIFDVYDDYNIRIRYIEKALKNQGYSVKIYFADFNHATKKPYDVHRDNVTYIPVPPYQRNLSVQRMYSLSVFAKKARKIAEEETDVSLIYLMMPPNSMAKQFEPYKNSHPEVKIWCDVLDMWPESLPFSKTMKKLASPVTHFWRILRDHHLKCADIVTTECDLFQEELKKYTTTKYQTVYLCHPAGKTTKKILGDTIHFVYTGSINHLLHIDLLIHFLKEAMRQNQIVLEIIGDGENREELIRQLKEADIPHIYHGSIYDEAEKEKIYAHCHYGINLMKDTVFVGLTMKSMDYLSYGIPLINNIASDTYNLVQTRNIGYNVSFNQPIPDFKEDAVYQRQCQNTTDVFNQYFTEEVIEQQLIQVIQELER